MFSSLPIIKLKAGHDRKVNSGHPWIYSNEIENNSALSEIRSGSLVRIYNIHGNLLGIGYYNRHSLIAARVISRNEKEIINTEFFVEKFKNALNLREDFFNKPYYRLIHSEADLLPGLVIDRFDKIFVCQITTSGMELLLDNIISALKNLFSNPIIYLKNDLPVRKLENLELYEKLVNSELSEENQLTENNLKFYFNPKDGQKTGWFFDQRKNRNFISSLCKDVDMLDVYCFGGGFGINAKNAGAKSVTFIDSSEEAINLARRNSELNNLSENCHFILGKAFDELENLNLEGKKYGVVVLDPPAFVKSKKDYFSGLKGYEKLVKMGANLVANNGYLFIASCSHNVSLEDLIKSSATGIDKAGRTAKIIRVFGADIDHPLHPFLKESEYLKSITYKLD